MVKNAAQRIVFVLLDADGDPVTGAATDTPDSEYSLNGATFVDCSDEIHEIATASGVYYLDLLAGETNGDVVAIQVKTATAGTKTTVLVFYTSAQSLDTTDTAVDGIQTDLSNVTDGLGALKALIDAIPTTAMRGTDNVVLAGPTKAEMDTAHGLLATPAQVATALTDIDLDHLTKTATSIPAVTAGTFIDQIRDDGTAVFDRTTDSLQALRDRGDAAWISGDATLANQTRLLQILTGKWEITGNQLIMYDSDGTTALYTFNLTQDGIGTEYNPDKRELA